MYNFNDNNNNNNDLHDNLDDNNNNNNNLHDNLDDNNNNSNDDYSYLYDDQYDENKLQHIDEDENRLPPWKELGNWITNWLFVEDNKKHPLYEAYTNLIQPRDIKYHYQDDEGNNNDNFAPYKNGLHFLMHLLYRSQYGANKITRELLDKFIVIIKSMKGLGFIKEAFYDQLPKNSAEIIAYDNAVPQFKLNTKHLCMTIHKPQTTKKYSTFNVINNNNDDDNKNNVNNNNDDDILWQSEPKMYYNFNELNYGDFYKSNRKLYYFSILEYITWFSLIPNWYKHLDFDFVHYNDVINPKTPIKKFIHTEFVKKHLTYSKEFVFELPNGEIFYKHCLIQMNPWNKNTMYWIKDVTFEPKNGLINKLQKEIQENIASMKQKYIKPIYYLHLYEIQLLDINDDSGLPQWCLTNINLKIQFDEYLCNFHNIKRIKNFDYNNILYQKLPNIDNDYKIRNIKIVPPQEQHYLVQNKGMFLWIQWAFDGTIVNLNQKSISNSIVHVINNNIGKKNNNIWRISSTPEYVPQRYIVHILCEEINKLRKGFVIWTCSDNLKGFKQRYCAGDLGLIILDGKERYYSQYSVGASKLNKIDGRLFVDAYKTGMKYPQEKYPHLQDYDLNLRQFDIQIPYQWKDHLHTLVHKIINKRIKGDFGGRQWISYPSNFINKGCGILGQPYKTWNDFDGNPFKWNFLRCSIAEFYHTTTFGCVTKLYTYLYNKFNHQYLTRSYQCLRDYIYENNDCLKHKSLSNFNSLNKENNMTHMYCKWFYISITLPFLLNWAYGIGELIQLIRFISRIAICDSEYERKQIHKQAKKLFKKLQNKYKDIVNSPKFRILKETIDLDLYLYSSISIIEGLYSEHTHQFPKNVKQNRSNNKFEQLEDLLKFFAINMGINYIINGGHYGTYLGEALGDRARNLADPDDENKINPIIKEFVLYCNEFFDNEDDDNDEEKQSILDDNEDDDNKQSIKPKNAHKHIFVKQESVDEFDEYFWNDWINNINEDENRLNGFKQFIQNEWNILYNDDNDISNYKQQFFVSKYTGIVIDDGKKSNNITFNYTKYKNPNKPWNYWFKILNDDNQEKLVNIEFIFKIKQKEQDNLHIFVGYGNIYDIYPAMFYNEYCSQDDYHDFLDTFDRNSPRENTKWFKITKRNILETVVVVHSHIINEQLSNNPKQNYTKAMQKYFRQINNKHLSTDYPIPCGPVLKCCKHNEINCTLFGCNNTKSYCTKWHCNTNELQSGHSIFCIWDAKNGWLPGIWYQFDKKKYTQYIL